MSGTNDLYGAYKPIAPCQNEVLRNPGTLEKRCALRDVAWQTVPCRNVPEPDRVLSGRLRPGNKCRLSADLSQVSRRHECGFPPLQDWRLSKESLDLSPRSANHLDSLSA